MSSEMRGNTNVQIYPSPENAVISINYTATINGLPVHVNHSSGFAGGDVSWISFDFKGTVTIAVTALRNIVSVEVCPISAGLMVEINGNVATLTIVKPCRLFLKWDGAFEMPFYIFANDIEVDPPVKETPGIKYFGPGEHQPGVIHLRDNESLYLAPGCIVHGVVHIENARSAKIFGRGILCTSHLDRNRPQPEFVEGNAREVITVEKSSGIEIEGITILDSHHWTVTFWDCQDVVVRNVKMFNERNFSTDGINPVNCRNVLIEDCFLRCKDDCISIKGLDQRYPGHTSEIENIMVQNCVFWSDNNNAVVIGSETKAQFIKNITFRNIDIVRVSNTCGDFAGALSIICLHDTFISDITFEDVRIEYCLGPYFNFFYTDSIFRIPGERQPQGGTIDNILLKNISITGGPLRSAYINGLDSRRLITNVRIENLRIHGKAVRNAADGRIFANEFTRKIEIVA